MKAKTVSWLKIGLLFVCLVFIAACGGGGGGSSAPSVAKQPVASFTSTTNGQSVQFNDTSTNNPTSWLWDFGDGGVSTEQNPTHTYAAGSYSPSLIATNAAGSSQPVNKNVTVAPPARVSLAAIPAADLTENLNILINQAHVNLFPELGNVAVYKAIIAEINAVIAKDPNNKKRYAFGKLIIYPDSDFNTTTNRISGNSAYIQANNHFVGNPAYGGTSLVLWFYDGIAQLTTDMFPKFFIDSGGGGGYSAIESVDGKIHNVAYVGVRGRSEDYLLSNPSGSNYVNGFSAHNAILSTVMHEVIGHPSGAGIPEQYRLNFTDKSGTLPNLSYDFSRLYFEDPMVMADVITYNVLQTKFSPFNSWLIAHNANHQLSCWQIADVVKTMTIKVKVIDKAGNPVPDATVVSYGAVATSGGSWGIAKDMVTQLETKITGADGTTSLTNRINTSWYVEGVKATYGSLRGGSVLNSFDMQAAYWMKNKDTFELVITVR